ncbi:hypothetical protein Trydic_g6401 [Trypoxylus dichotomus]
MPITNIQRIYYPFGCAVCLKAEPNIKRCSNCKLAAYCSKTHHISDWEYSHKHFCKAVSACNRNFTPKISNFEEWTNYRIGRQYILENMLKRDLSPQEILMNHFSPVCVVCFSIRNLFCCPLCFNVAYCSKEHQLGDMERHRKHCATFKLGLLTDQYINFKGLLDEEFDPMDRKPLTCTKDILKYIKHSVCNLKHEYLTEQQELLAVDIVKVERLTLGLNLLHALNLVKCTKQLLIIHIVGASDLELESNWGVITEILANWLNISYVAYHLIGPDIKSVLYKPTKSAKYEVHFHSNFYHEICNEIDKPDLIAAFNCGLHEFEREHGNPWLKSIPELLHHPYIPLLLTSFTKTELIRDKKIISDLNYKLNVILDVEKNPFAFLKPLRDWLSLKEPIFYRCNYLHIVQKLD